MAGLSTEAKTSSINLIEIINESTATYNSLELPCVYTKIPYKFKRQTHVTLTGKTKELYVDIFNKWSVTISYLTEQDYRTLYNMWKSLNDLAITTGLQQTKVMIDMDELNFQRFYNRAADEVYYTGSLNLKEVF